MEVQDSFLEQSSPRKQSSQLNDYEYKSNSLRITGNKKELEYQNYGRWDYIENQRYLEFIEQERVNGFSLNQVFARMAKYIKTRSNQQCRSHHQKFNPYKGQISFKKRIHKRSSQEKRKDTKEVGVQTQINTSIDYELVEQNLNTLSQLRTRFERIMNTDDIKLSPTHFFNFNDNSSYNFR